MLAILIGGGLALLVSLLGTRVAINILTEHGYGQEIRDDGPTTHHTKRGTPTMGGLVIVLASVLAYFIATFATGADAVPGWTGRAVVTAGRDEAMAWVRENVGSADVVLVKASRGAALEHIADGLLDAGPDERGATP